MLGSSKEGRDAAQALGRYGSLGFSLAAGILLFSLLGAKIDAKFDCAPLGLAVGCLLGGALGLYKLVRDVIRQGSQDDRQQDG